MRLLRTTAALAAALACLAVSADQLPAERKVDLRPLAPGQLPQNYVRATDFNAILDRLDGSLNVKNFGAVCDWNGSTGTDDRAAIQAALDAGAGKTVIVPGPGKCRVNGTLSVSSGTKVLGYGGATLVQRLQNTKLLSIYGAADVTIENLALEGYGLGDWAVVKANANLQADTLRGADATVYSCADAVGVYVYGSTRVKLLSVTATKFRSSGIRFVHSDKLQIVAPIVVGLYPDDVGGTMPPAGACNTFAGSDPGIYPPTNTGYSSFGIDHAAALGDPATYPTYDGVLVTGAHVSKTSFGLFSAPGIANATWSNNQVADVAQHCGYFYPGPNFTLDHNTCDKPNFNGWKIQALTSQYAYPLVGMRMTNNSASRGRLSSNGFIVTMTDSTNGGGASDGTRAGGVFRGVTMTGNSVSQWTGVAYHVDHVDGLTMVGNTATDVLSYGAQIHDSTGTVSDNTFTGVSRESLYVTSSIGRTLTASRNVVNGAPPPPTWAGSTVYVPGEYVKNGANIYACYQGGTSAASGGPTGTNSLAVNGLGITDGTVVWAYVASAAAMTPLAYLFATWAYEPVTAVNSTYYLKGTTISNGSNFYAAMTSATSGTTSGARPTCTSGTCTDGGVVWAWLGTTASSTPRGTVVFSDNVVNQGPTDTVTYSAYYTNATNNPNFVSVRNVLPTRTTDGSTFLPTRYEGPFFTAWGGDVSGGAYSGAPYTAPAGAQGVPGRDFISNGATPSVVDSAGRTIRHQTGDRSWNINPATGVASQAVCISGATPCAAWLYVQPGLIASKSTDSVGAVSLSGGVYTLNYSKTYSTNPLCVCTNSTNFANGCRVSGSGTSSVTFSASGATDTIIYHCAIRD